MSRAIAINGSPQMEKGSTEMVLALFLQGMTEAGYDSHAFLMTKEGQVTEEA